MTRTVDSSLDRVLPSPVVGGLAGFGLGFLAAIGLRMLVPGLPGGTVLAAGGIGAVAGGVLGWSLRQRAGAGWGIARWCVTLTAVLGGVSFLAGFVGPILLRPDSPQGPLLGIFITGPLGAILGAVLGLLVGIVRRFPRSG